MYNLIFNIEIKIFALMMDVKPNGHGCKKINKNSSFLKIANPGNTTSN